MLLKHICHGWMESNHLPRNVSESGEACESEIRQVKQPVSWLNDETQQDGRQWSIKDCLLYPVQIISSVRNTLWGDGTEAYTSAERRSLWLGWTHTHVTGVVQAGTEASEEQQYYFIFFKKGTSGLSEAELAQTENQNKCSLIAKIYTLYKFVFAPIQKHNKMQNITNIFFVQSDMLVTDYAMQREAEVSCWQPMIGWEHVQMSTPLFFGLSLWLHAASWCSCHTGASEGQGNIKHLDMIYITVCVCVSL